ncbi:MAG: isopentenyl phosphate kinase family protein [Candidatus Heimdallarchaeota archaeon]|nr:isopentenyl phosphate kinase family protein [Candidatus Heimdallarchaeota archaeon]
MKNEQIDIIKIGGSIITNKSEYRTLRKKQLLLLSKELAKWEKKCIIIHGAGSFGHTVANQYSIHLGFSNQNQLKGILQIRKDMLELTEAVTHSLVENGVNALSFQTSAIVFENEGGFSFHFNPVKKALSLGFCPILSGDVLFTEAKGFRIFSGDALIRLLVQHFDVGRVIFISDVDGLFLQDPETKEDKLVSSLTTNDFENVEIGELNQDDSKDVTGEMRGKIEEIKSILEHTSEVILVNGFHPERLTLVREGDKFVGTTIINENST